MSRHINFNPGPSTIPLAALERAQSEFLDIQGSGMSILEHSHRGKLYEAIHEEALALLRELMAVPDSYEVLFMQGGATAQFALVPMNLRSDAHGGDYVVTGNFANKAYAEAKIVGAAHLAWKQEQDGKYTRLPARSELDLSEDAPFVHLASNNTIMGTEFFEFPETSAPLVVDMSSDIMGRVIDVAKLGLIYAGTQKNMGPSGLAVVIVRKELLETARTDIPKIFRYSEIAKNNSLQNTIPTFSVYMLRNVLLTYKERGGIAAIEKINREKAKLLYEAVDASDGFYRCGVSAEYRSIMNAVFNLADADQDKKFVAAAAEQGMVGLKGHRLVGGIRASMYNAMPLESVEKLTDFMARFKEQS